MNRRDFLKVSFAAGLATAIPVVLTEALEKRLPVIYGDGVHDDSEGLQAALNGKEFVCRDACVRVSNGEVFINSGYYRLSKSLDMTDARAIITNCIFTTDEWRDSMFSAAAR